MSSPASGTSQSGYAGQWSPHNGATRFNATSFMITQMLGLINTATLVQVQACTNTSAVAAVGTVDVLPLLNLLDGQGNSSPPAQIFKLPYFRLQGGKNAIIDDPVKGDIGLAVFAQRDISAVKRTKKQANPASPRRFALSDGLYLGGFLNTTPTQWFRFINDNDGNPTGLEVVDVNGNSIVLNSTGMTMTDKNSNVILTDSAGIHLNGVLIDRSRNMSNIVDLTNSGNSNLSGASQAVKLADGSNATKVKGT